MRYRCSTNRKFLKKKNTFTDFVNCAEHLVAEKYTSSEKLAIAGGSAGGRDAGVRDAGGRDAGGRYLGRSDAARCLVAG